MIEQLQKEQTELQSHLGALSFSILKSQEEFKDVEAKLLVVQTTIERYKSTLAATPPAENDIMEEKDAEV